MSDADPLPARGVVFDLDGTLLDSFAGIGASLDHARRTLGLPPLAPGEAERMVGFGLERLIEQAFPPSQRAAAIDIYRAHYQQHCVEGTSPMPGAQSTLMVLRARGFQTGVATNKPTAFSRTLLDGLGLSGWIDVVAGAEPGVAPKPDPAILRRALAELGLAPELAIYVGDMHVDIETGAAAGVRVVAVSTGAESGESLARHAPARVIATLPELLELVGEHPV